MIKLIGNHFRRFYLSTDRARSRDAGFLWQCSKIGVPNNPSAAIPTNDMKNPKLGVFAKCREPPKDSKPGNVLILAAHKVRQVIRIFNNV